MCVLDVHVGQTEVPTVSLGDDPQMNLPRSLMSPGDGRVLLSLWVSQMGNSSRRRGSAGNGHSPGMDSITVMCFPRTSSTPGEMCAVELESMTAMSFPRTSPTPGEMYTVELESRTVFPEMILPRARAAQLNWTFPWRASHRVRVARKTGTIYGRPGWLDRQYARVTVTGSLLFGSPHRQSSLRSAVLSLRRIDDLDIFRRSTDIPQNHHLVTVVSRITPDICLSAWTDLIAPSCCGEIGDIAHWKRLGQYLIPLGDFVRSVLILCYFCRVFVTCVMASSRSPDMDQAGPSYAPSDPLPGTFLGLALDIRSEKLYHLAPDIPDVMGLRTLRPSISSRI